MSRVGAVVEGYLHSPDPRAFTRLARTYRNWPTVMMARLGVRGYPVLARRRLGDQLLVRKHGDVDLFAHREARWLPEGASLHLFDRDLAFETDATGALCDTYFRQHYRALPVAGRGVLDLGALDGDTAIYFRLRGAVGVVAVEVDPKAAIRLRANLARNGIEGITVLEERAQRLEPYLAALDRLALPGADAGYVLKMDIEGDEEPLLEHSADADVRRFDHVVLEYHRGPDRCLRRLRTLGYRLRWDPPLRHPNGDRCGLIWADRNGDAR
ncbi:MAG TPA: hypothetical protein VFG07_10575 [Thermoplasmata archaeon]|nr:hypothetical protein [Thermoplasmata archaeon]